jgi:hypothetical protein
MPNDDLLLREVLAEARATREKIDEIQSKMVKQDDFLRFQDTITKKVEALEEEQLKMKPDIADSTRFISSIRWGVRVAAIAVIGLLITGASSLIHFTPFASASSYNNPGISASTVHPPTGPADYNLPKH